MTILDTAPAAAELVLPYDAPRELWLAERTKGIGGSDALACVGLDPWKTRLEVYLDKLGQAPERVQTERMRWGQIVEAAILDWFVEQTGMKIRRLGLMRSIAYPWQLASLDAEAEDGAVVEIKNTNYHRRDEWEDDQVADGAECQSQHYMGVVGATHAWVVAQIGGEPPVIRRVERDDAFIGDIRAAELELWQMVQARTAPPLEGGAAAERLVKRLYPHGIDGKTVQVDATFLAKIRDYRTHLAAEKAAEKAKKVIGVELAHVMGDATEAWHNSRLVATRHNHEKATASLAELRDRYPLVAADPDIVTTTRYRKLHLKKEAS